jgi:hypothetical protein
MRISSKKAVSVFFCGLFLICLTVPAFSQNMFRKINDFDGDGKADFAVTRDINGLRYWYIWQTTDGFRAFQWGIDIDQNAPGDYDGDGKTDFAVYREVVLGQDSSAHSWWIYGSQTGARGVFWNWNDPESFVRQQDYDGDGKTDIAISYGQHQMSITPSGGGLNIGHLMLGGNYIKIGDVNGDAKADVANYNPTTNIVSIKHSPSNNAQSLQFGLAGDQFVAADFDGDGKGDLTVFRESDGTWWWMRSSDNIIQAQTFGTMGDIPVPADYDGDGKTDIAIWRSGEQSYFWVYGSQVGVFAMPWGTSGDSVVTY